MPVMRGYYCDIDCLEHESDNDNNDSECSAEMNKLYADMVKLCLTPRKQVTIYTNNAFVTPAFEEKYLWMIQAKMNGTYGCEYPQRAYTGAFTKMSEVVRITKKEIRIER